MFCARIIASIEEQSYAKMKIHRICAHMIGMISKSNLLREESQY